MKLMARCLTRAFRQHQPPQAFIEAASYIDASLERVAYVPDPDRNERNALFSTSSHPAQPSGLKAEEPSRHIDSALFGVFVHNLLVLFQIWTNVEDSTEAGSLG